MILRCFFAFLPVGADFAKKLYFVL